MELSKYNEIILDFDGVILDSNEIKKEAIAKASCLLLNKEKSDEFVKYFINNNGITREEKIKKFFPKQKDYCKILNAYNDELSFRLENANFTEGLNLFLDKLNSYKLSAYILSGGDRDEIISILKKKKYLNKFKEIMGGPIDKYKNFENLNLKGKILYIGDSKIDYELAKYFKLDFVFMYGYTQFDSWKVFFKDKTNILIVKNFEVLAKKIKEKNC